MSTCNFLVSQFVLTYMKILSFLIALLICQVSWTQNIYGSVSGGYQRIVQEAQPPLRVVNSSHTLADPWFNKPVYLSFSEALRTDLNFGHFFTKNVGYELSGSYLKPFTEITDDSYTSSQLSGRFYQASFKVILSKKINRFDVYAKMGVNFAKGIMYYDQKVYSLDYEIHGRNEARLVYEYSNGAQWGFNSALGFSFNLNSRLSVYSEVNVMYQPFEPERGQMTHLTYDDENMMQYYDDPFNSEIQFVEEVYTYDYDVDETSQPEKMYKRSYSLDGIGINLGVKFILFADKEEEKSAP